MKKRFLSVILCTALTAGMLLSGCGEKDSGGSPKNSSGTDDGNESGYSEFLTVDVFDSMANYEGIQTGWFGKIVKDKFNMELNIIAPNVSGGGDTLFQTRSTSGNLGDLVIIGAQNGRFADTVKAGLLMDMTDLIKDKDLMKNWEFPIRKANELVEEEGIYAIPSEVSNQSPEVSCEGLDPTEAPYVRWDAFKAAGYPQMKNLDDYLEVMKQMQEKVPESDSGKPTYAISLFKDWDGNMMQNAAAFTSLYGYKEQGFVLTKGDGSDMQDLTASDSIYVKVLKFLFDANQAGLVDPESTTQDFDTLGNKYADGQILTGLWKFLTNGKYNTTEHKAEGKGYMPALIEDAKCYSYGCYSTGNTTSSGIIGIGSKAQDPQRMADFIDWLYSPEGAEISGQANGAAGPMGLTWEMKDGKAVRTEFGTQALSGGGDVAVPEEWGGGTFKDGVSALNFKALSMVDIDPNTNEPYLAEMWESVLSENNSELDKDWQKYAEGAKTAIEFFDSKDALMVAPGTSYTAPDEESDITTLRNQCKEKIVDNSWRMVFAENEAEFDTLLKDMQDTVQGLGYADVLAVDMQNAKDQAASRKQAVEEFNNADK